MVFEREKSGRLNKLRLLKVSLTIQNTLKVNISDNTVKYYKPEKTIYYF